ncbi:hypothetical protein TNCV_1526071 [Trichonephila clavipes]|nr:hypothetical protein TNCV_1526071 [Trichonephila clavipes]
MHPNQPRFVEGASVSPPSCNDRLLLGRSSFVIEDNSSANVTHTSNERATETVLFAGMCARNLTKTESDITVQRTFPIKFGSQPPNDNNILSLQAYLPGTGVILDHERGSPEQRPAIALGWADVRHIRKLRLLGVHNFW